MLYMHCHRCNLTLEVRSSYLTLEHCPRCIARARIATPLVIRNDQPYSGSTATQTAVTSRGGVSTVRSLRLRA
jgi:hypothetical protein